MRLSMTQPRAPTIGADTSTSASTISRNMSTTSSSYSYQRSMTSRNDWVVALESTFASFNDWHPGIEGIIIDNIHVEVGKLSNHRDRAMFETSTSCPNLMTLLELVSLCRSAGLKTDDWPDGHHAAPTTWEKGYGSVTIVASLPAKGTFEIPPHSPGPSTYAAKCMDSSFSHPIASVTLINCYRSFASGLN